MFQDCLRIIREFKTILSNVDLEGGGVPRRRSGLPRQASATHASASASSDSDSTSSLSSRKRAGSFTLEGPGESSGGQAAPKKRKK